MEINFGPLNQPRGAVTWPGPWPGPGPLKDLYDNANKRDMPVIPLETIHFLQWLLSVHQPVNILEIGCAIGFSASFMAYHIPENGHITTIDRYDVMIREAKENFKQLQLAHKITLLEGFAQDILPTLSPPYDMIFMDCAKGQYLHLLPDCLRLLKTGGILLADDVLQGGLTTQNRYRVPRRQRTIHKRMQGFLYALFHTEGLVSTLLPLGDGLTLTHKTRNIIIPANLEDAQYEINNQNKT